MRKSKKRIFLGVVFILIIISLLFFIFNGPNNIKKRYYARKTTNTLKEEAKKLGPSLIELGVTDLSRVKADCVINMKTDASVKPVSCVTNYNNLNTYPAQNTIDSGLNSAENLSNNLFTNGWSNSYMNLYEWYAQVLYKADYNSDISFYRLSNGTLCTLNFSVAYANPAPPATNVTYSCSAPVDKINF